YNILLAFVFYLFSSLRALHSFPTRRSSDLFVADLGVERHFTGLKWKPWIGVRMYNAFDSFIPADVQANLSSPAFGSFYNSEIQRSEEHTSELQSRVDLVCRLLLEKKKYQDE